MSARTQDQKISLLQDAKKNFLECDFNPSILISVSEQTLSLFQADKLQNSYSISTSKHGTGEKEGSKQTPLGSHKVAELIGEGCPPRTIFKARKPQDLLAEIITTPHESAEELITSRIIWLEGLESNINKGSGVDSYQRYIYIHGTHEEGLIGVPSSIGCIRMRNVDVIDLFNCIQKNTFVLILD